jgi:hypothetical protein
MVAHCLIIFSGIAGPQIEELVVGSVVTSTECDTCKARHPYPGSPDQLGSDVYLDGSIAKLGSVDKRKGGLIHGIFGQTNGFAASILDRYRFHARRDQQVRGVG